MSNSVSFPSNVVISPSVCAILELNTTSADSKLLISLSTVTSLESINASCSSSVTSLSSAIIFLSCNAATSFCKSKI